MIESLLDFAEVGLGSLWDTNHVLRGPVLSALGGFGSASFDWKGVSLSTMEKVHDTSPLNYQTFQCYSDRTFPSVLSRKSVSELHVQELNASFDFTLESTKLTYPQKELSRDPSSQPQYMVRDMYMFNMILDFTVPIISVTFIGI